MKQSFFVKSDLAKLDGNIALGRIFLELALDERIGKREIAPVSSEFHETPDLIGEIYSDYEETMTEYLELVYQDCVA